MKDMVYSFLIWVEREKIAWERSGERRFACGKVYTHFLIARE